ncbi:MAG: outer membrane beta-barrel protein, partial [Siphonobacter sp.]
IKPASMVERVYSSVYRWDEVDFGFGGGITNGGNSGDVIVSGGMVIISNGSSGDRGFNNAYAGGVNYNYETKKEKFSSNYYYNQKRNWLDQITKRQSILSDNSFETNSNSSAYTKTDNHKVDLRYENNIDSLNTIILLATGNLGNTNGTNRSNEQNLKEGVDLTNRYSLDNGSNGQNVNFNGSALFRHKFRQKGKVLAASLNFNLNNSTTDATQKSNYVYYLSSGDSTFTQQDLISNSKNHQRQFRASLSYVQPLSKRIFWENFYNFGVRNDEVDRDVFNHLEANQRSDSLSRYYTNQLIHNRLGTSLRYNFKGLNISAGLAGIWMYLDGKFSVDQSSTDVSRIQKQYNLVVPRGGISYDMKNNRWLYMEYVAEAQQPSIKDLQPIVDYTNATYITEGNPNLKPTVNHQVYGGYSFFNPATFTNLFANINYNYQVNQVVYNQTVDSLLVTRTKPANVTGGQSYGTYLSVGFPIKKNVLKLGLNSSLNFGKSYTLVNDIKNQTNSNNYSVGLNAEYTPSDNFTFYGNANWRYNDVNYSINTTQNQNIWNNSYSGQMNVKLPLQLYFNTTFNYNIYKNDRFGLNQNIPILNMAIYHLLGKAKKSEIRLSAYDLLRKNLGVTQSASSNYFIQSQVQTVTRYFMISYTYNMRGIKAKMRRESY